MCAIEFAVLHDIRVQILRRGQLPAGHGREQLRRLQRGRIRSLYGFLQLRHLPQRPVLDGGRERMRVFG
jgi:hypothetical protein